MRGFILVILIGVIIVIIFQVGSSLPSKDDILHKITAIPIKPSFGRGGGIAPVTIIGLTEEGINYDISPGKLKFEHNGKSYLLHVRRVKNGYVDFIMMGSEMDSYSLNNTFSLKPNEKKDIDIDEDGKKDISIKLNNIKSRGKNNSLKSADFSIKKINNKKDE